MILLWSLIFLPIDMDALKRKAKATLEDIKHAENKQKDLTRHVRMARERADLAEFEVENLEARIKLKKQELENCCKKVEDEERCHRAKEEVAEESEKERKLLEGKGFDLDDELAVLAIKLRDAREKADEVEDRVSESKGKYSCLKSDLSELLARLNVAESKICRLSEDADSDTVRLINLEIKHKRYGQRSEYFEDKIEMIEEQVKNLTVEASSNEADIKLLVVQRDKLKGKEEKEVHGMDL